MMVGQASMGFPQAQLNSIAVQNQWTQTHRTPGGPGGVAALLMPMACALHCSTVAGWLLL